MSNAAALCTYIKPDGYFSCPRTELLPLVPAEAARFLEIGCGEGEFARALRAARGQSKLEVVGVELCEGPGQRAAAVLDTLIVGNVEQMELPYRDYFDCVVFADVLEHLVDPWKMLTRARSFLRPNGMVIASIPNVQQWIVLRDLILGEWDYTDFGIMDNTHLRFFTKKSILKMFASTGFDVRHFHGRIESGKGKFLHVATGGLADPFLARQYFITAVRKDE